MYNKYLYWYLGIVFGGIWLVAGPFMLFGPELTPIIGKLTLFAPISIILLYLPSVAGLIVYYKFGGSAAIKGIFLKLIPRKADLIWFPILFCVFILFVISMRFGSILIGIKIPHITYSYLKIFKIVVFNFIKEVGLLGGIFGWIGFLLPFLQRKLNNNISSGLLTGFIFGLWVFPGYIIPSFHTTSSYSLYVLQLMAFILFQSYVFNATRGNLLIYLFCFWLAATGSHIQLYYFNPMVQILEISFFIVAAIVVQFIFKAKKIDAPLQKFPDFIQRNQEIEITATQFIEGESL